MNNEMKLFTPERLDSYINDRRIIAQLNGYKLITYEEFKFGNSMQDVEQKLLEIVSICNLKNDEGNISKYCIHTVNLLMNNEKFDALFAMKETTSGNFEVDGFVITELGECSSKPNTYAVNLICTQNRFKAAILLGGYIYCIKQLPEKQHEAILELASHYDNVAGFISYTKMGFTKNMNLLSPDCFWDLESINLPMYIDNFTFRYFYHSLDDIIKVVIGDKDKKLEYVNDLSGYYELYNNKSGISDEKKKEEKRKFEDEWCAHLKTLSIKTDETKFWEKYKDDKENISEYPCLKNYVDYPYVESNLKNVKKQKLQKLLSPPLLSSRRRLTPGRYNFESKRSSKRSKKRSSKRSKKRSSK